MPPQVSAIIPCYNSSAWIRESVESVLSQTYQNLEIIVVDDGSQDSTMHVLRDYGAKLQVLCREHTGIGAARNAGIEAAQGEYIAFLDSDDLWQPDKICKQVEFMAQNQHCSMVYADAEEFRGAETDPKSFFAKFPSLASSTDIAEPMVLDWAVPLTSTVMVRRDFLQRHGIHFHATASCAEDVSMFLEIYLHGGEICRMNELLARRRLHDSNSSGDHYNRFLQRLTIYGELLQRYRNAPPRAREVIEAGLRDANFRVAERYWGDLDLQKARNHFRAAMAFDAIGIRSSCLWAFTFAPKRVLVRLKKVKRRVSRTRASDLGPAIPNSIPGQSRARD
jgi:glycosyltransferase involved in cell wall biosynthesis